MRTLRLSLAITVALTLLGLSGAVLAQDEGPSAAGVVAEVVWELPIPSEALPEEFVKLGVDGWTLAPGADSTESTNSVLGNEALRGRGLVVEGGSLVITPATDALLWRGTGGSSETSPLGETVTLAVGDAIFLPAVPDAEVEREAPIGIANPGDQEATALSFHTHQQGGTFYGYPLGLTLGDWDMAATFDPVARETLDGADVLFRLTRFTAEPGSLIPTTDGAVGLYFVETGNLEQVASGPGGEISSEWPAGKNGFLYRAEGLEHTLSVIGDTTATVLELAAIPQPIPAE